MSRENMIKVYPVRMSQKQYDAFKRIAALRGENRSELIRKWIDDYINRHTIR